MSLVASFSGVVTLKKEPFVYKPASTYFKKLATVIGALSGYNSISIVPAEVSISQLMLELHPINVKAKTNRRMSLSFIKV